MVNSNVTVPGEWEKALRFVMKTKADRLDFGREEIGNAGVGALALLLIHVNGTFSQVDQLLLDRCDIGTPGVVALSEALAGGALPLLEKLSLASNRIQE